jgi:hypothetical protein
MDRSDAPAIAALVAWPALGVASELRRIQPCPLSELLHHPRHVQTSHAPRLRLPMVAETLKMLAWEMVRRVEGRLKGH